jgi:hypothetical protein
LQQQSQQAPAEHEHLTSFIQAMIDQKHQRAVTENDQFLGSLLKVRQLQHLRLMASNTSISHHSHLCPPANLIQLAQLQALLHEKSEHEDSIAAMAHVALLQKLAQHTLRAVQQQPQQLSQSQSQPLQVLEMLKLLQEQQQQQQSRSFNG